MNREFAKQHSGKFPLLSLRPLLLLGALLGFSQVRPLALTEAEAMTPANSIAGELRDPRFTRTWVITLRSQYRAAAQYRLALRRPQTLPRQKSLEIRYRVAACEYNRMAREAPAAAFQTLSQPRRLP